MAGEVVVWSGSLERAAIESTRIYAATEPHQPRIPDRVLDWLHRHGESTMPEIAEGLGVDQGAVNTALYALRHAGRVESSGNSARTANGRLAKYYRLREA